MGKSKINVKLDKSLVDAMNKIPKTDLNRAIRDIYTGKKIVWDDRFLPIEENDQFTYQELKAFKENVDASIRLCLFYDQKVTIDWFDQTLLFQREFCSQQDHENAKSVFKDKMHDAYKLGLISEENYKKSAYSKDPAFEYDDSDDKTSDPKWKHTQFWYIKHITFYYTLAAYSALYRIWTHIGADSKEVSEGKERTQFYMEMPIEHKDPMMFYVNHGGISSDEYKKHLTDIFWWFIDIVPFFSINNEYLERIVAEVNVRAGEIVDSCKLNRADLIRVTGKSKKPLELNPSVISLWSRYKYLGEKYQLNPSDSVKAGITFEKRFRKGLMIGKLDLDRINLWCGKGRLFLKKAKEWRQIFEEIKPQLSKPEAQIWEKRFMVIIVTGYAVEYWYKRLHMIGIQDKDLKVAVEVEPKMIDDLRDGIKKIEDWCNGEVISNLHLLQREFQELNEKQDIETISDSPEVRNFVRVLKGLPREEIEEESPRSDPSADAEEMDRLIQILDGLDRNGWGCSQAIVCIFFDVTTLDMNKPPQNVQYKVTKENAHLHNGKKPGTVFTISERPKKHGRTETFIKKVFEKEYPKLSKKPPKGHAIYQEFLGLFSDDDVRDDKNGLLEIISSRYPKGPDAQVMAKFLLEKLPIATRKRLSYYDSIVSVDDQES